MSAPTPGPWHVSKDQPIVFDADSRVVADCYQHDGSSYAERYSSYAERYANACLIAAAPDLLAALIGLVDYCDGIGTATADQRLDDARAAIAKAV